MADNETPSIEEILTETPVETTVEQPKEPDTKEQPRTEGGQFAAKEEQKAEVVTAKPEGDVKPEGKEADDKDGNVPSWRLREVAEERRKAEAERDTLRGSLAQMQARLATLEKPKEQPKQEDIDPLLDPQGFAKRITSSFEGRLQEERLNYNLGLAHVRHGDKFEKAYNALLQEAQSGNRQIVPQLTSQTNPGEAIVKWFNERETLREVGGDPAAYKSKLLEDALKDPAYLAKAIEAAKTSAGQPRTNNITQLPPSLARATGSGNPDSDSEVSSVEALLGR